MKTIAIVCFCLALLPAIILGDSDSDDKVSLFEQVVNTANKNGIINGIFKPTKNGFLGEGSCGFLYEGELLKPVRRPVAMKFIPPRNKEYAEKEYSMYTYLEAINNPGVERYGIPAVYYYGFYQNYTLMAFTLLDKDFNSVFNDFRFDILDFFVTVQEFVRITKFIHYHGIVHKDLTFDNVMFRRSRGFIIDYNVSEKMYESKNKAISPAALRENAKQMAKRDWQQFFFPMCYYAGIMFDLSEFGANPLKDFRMIMDSLKEIEYPGLKRVFAEFAKHAFGGESRTQGAASNGGKGKMVQANTSQSKPFYDQMNDIINEEIARLKVPKPNFVSWMKDSDVKMATMEATQIPNISTIKDRFERSDAKYPDVHLDYFEKLLSKSGANDDKCSEAESSSSIQQKKIKISV